MSDQNLPLVQDLLADTEIQVLSSPTLQGEILSLTNPEEETGIGLGDVYDQALQLGSGFVRGRVSDAGLLADGLKFLFSPAEAAREFQQGVGNRYKDSGSLLSSALGELFKTSDEWVAAVDPYLADRTEEGRYAEMAGQFISPGGYKNMLKDAALGAIAQGGMDAGGPLGGFIAPVVAPAAAKGLWRTTKKGVDTLGSLFGIGAEGRNQEKLFKAKQTAKSILEESVGMPAEEAIEVIERSISEGKKYPAGVYTQTSVPEIFKDEPKTAQLYSHITRSGDGKAEVVANYDRRNLARNEYLDSLTEAKETALDDVGQLLLDRTEENARTAAKTLGEAYNKFDANSSPFDFQPIRDATTDIDLSLSKKHPWQKAQIEERGLFSAIERTSPELEFSGGGTREDVEFLDMIGVLAEGKGPGGQVQQIEETVGNALKLRRTANALLRKGNLNKRSEEALTMLVGSIDEQLATQVPDVADAYGSLNDAYAKAFGSPNYKTKKPAGTFHASTPGGEVLNTKAGKRDAFKTLVPGKHEARVEQGAAALDVASSESTRDLVRRGIIQRMRKSVPEGTLKEGGRVDTISPSAFKNWLNSNEAAINKYFTPEEIRNFNVILDGFEAENKVIKNIKGLASNDSITTPLKENTTFAEGTLLNAAKKTLLNPSLAVRLGSGGVQAAFLGRIIDSIAGGELKKDVKLVEGLLIEAMVDNPQNAIELLQTASPAKIEKLSSRLMPYALEKVQKLQRTYNAMSQEEQAKNRGEIEKLDSLISDMKEAGQLGEGQGANDSEFFNQGLPQLGDWMFDDASEAKKKTAAAMSNNHDIPVAVSDSLQTVADEIKFPHHILKSMAAEESSFNPNAKNKTSGATGLIQLMPKTADWLARKYGVQDYDLTNSYDNLKLGGLYINELYQKYGDMELALTAYHQGPGRVDKALKKTGATTLDGIMDEIGPIGRKYARNILKRAERYRKE